jgi:hypothetical protein
MIFSSQDQWLNLQGEFAQYESDILWCDKKIEIEINFSNILDNSSKALVELEIDTCLSDLFIYNKFSAEEIIINFKESGIKLSHIEVFGPAASITMLSNKDAFFSNVITKNINKITYISGSYKGLVIGSSEIIYEKANTDIFINNWSSAGLLIEGAKIILAGEIKAFPILSVNLYGTKQQDYSLDTSNLKSITTDILNILDVSKSKFGIKLLGNILVLSNSTIQGKDLILANGTLTSLKVEINLKGSGELLGAIQSSAINITSTNLIIKDNGLMKSVSFQKEDYLHPARTINLELKKNFICSENGKIISDAKIIANIGKSFNFDCIADAKNSIIFKGKVETGKITSNATIISRQSDITFDLNNNKNFVMDGLVVAQQGAIKYITGKKFISNGITAGVNGVSILQASSNLSTVEINQFSEAIEARWKAIINSTAEHKVTSSLISFGNQIVIQANIIYFNKESSILNVLSANVKPIISSETKITADSYIYHNASIFITNGNIIEKASGKNKDGFGIIFVENSHIESETGKILVNSASNIKFEGNITAYDIVSIEASCLENNHNSAINSLGKNTKIKLKQCHFINNGVIYSGATLNLNVDGGDIENQHVIAGNELKIHGGKNFINYAHILSHNNAKIGLGLNGKILLKPESVMYVGSYDLGHFSEMYRVRIGEVDCHGCSIKTIKPVTSSISAELLSIRINHYENTPDQQIAQRTFRVEEWKERHYIKVFGAKICTGVSHRWRDVTLTLYENHHNYYGPAHISHAGDLALDAGSVIVDKSYIGGEGRADFRYPSVVTVISAQAEERVVLSRGDVTHMNSLDRVKNAFGLAAADVAYDWGNIAITQPTDKIGGVVYFKKGITGNFQKIELGNSKSYFGSNSNAVLPATDSSVPAKIMADITIDNASKGKTVIVYNWKTRNNELEIITPEQL